MEMGCPFAEVDENIEIAKLVEMGRNFH